MAASNAYRVAPDGGMRLSHMIVDVDRQTLSTIRNPDLRSYAVKYIDISEDFMAQVRRLVLRSILRIINRRRRPESINCVSGVGFFVIAIKVSTSIKSLQPASLARRALAAKRFSSRSSVIARVSTVSIPIKRVRSFLRLSARFTARITTAISRRTSTPTFGADGREPLLHPKRGNVEFFRQASDKLPDAFNRLYTTGDQLDAELLRQLRDAGLDEIRFSIRMHDLEKGHRHTFDRIALAKNYIPYVMVEMPILPDTFEIMKDVLLELERLDVSSINLLEFCYPLNNAETYNRKGYKVKHRPYRVLYNYWYAGGLPIARSELVCLDLMLFALDAKLKMGVHYCSLENKHTGRFYQQNTEQRPPQNYYFSPNDYFLKTAKVFGADIRQTRKILRHQKSTPHNLKDTPGYLEFHVSQIDKLKGLNVEVGLSYNVFETRQGEPYLRELKTFFGEAGDL